MTNLDHLMTRMAKIASAPFEQATILPSEFYTAPEILALEEEHLFKAEWQCPGLASDIPNPGDYITYAIAGEPIFTIRGKNGSVRTFANTCRHRMMQLLDGKGTARRLVCPYHSWAYDLGGQLIGVPHEQYFKDLRKSDVCLPEFRTEVWQGFIYVTLNAQAPSVSDQVSPLNDLLDRFQLADYIPITTQDHVWATNWKLLTENYMESYHLPFIHRATVGGYFPVSDCVFPDELPGAFTYSTFTKGEGSIFGRAHPDNDRLEGAWRSTNVLPTIFPSHMFTVAPDYMWYLSLAPQGTGQVRIRYGAALAPEVVAAMKNPDREIADAVAFLDEVNNEDRAVVEGAYRGACAPNTTSGPIHQFERGIHHFIVYLANRLNGGGAEGVWEAAE